MRIKSILLLLVCFLLSGLTVSVIAHECVPACKGCQSCEAGVCVDDPDNCIPCQNCVDANCVDDDDLCEDCETCSIGYCDWDCDTCYKCESDTCVPCKCWDDGDAITGSITVQDAKLCEEVTHTSSITDTDHWSLGGDGEGNTPDTITYSWIITDEGNNPETGTFTGATNEATVNWKAPPCKGTVVIKLDADDVPDSMDNPCPDSERDDPNKVFQGTSTVSLPTGCDDCVGDPVISLELIGIQSFDPCDCDWGGCGYIDKPTNLDIFVLTPCYDGCKWRFGVTATADVLYGPCLIRENYTPIDFGDDPDLTEDNYCEIVDGFDYDPNDESTGTGCACAGATGPGCEGGTLYSNTACLMDHEQGHFDDQKSVLQIEEDLLALNTAFDDMLIDCSDPDSKTCMDALNAREAAIIQAVKDAYDYCVVCNEVVARTAAKKCFSDLAIAICLHAEIQGWADCDECE